MKTFDPYRHAPLEGGPNPGTGPRIADPVAALHTAREALAGLNRWLAGHDDPDGVAAAGGVLRTVMGELAALDGAVCAVRARVIAATEGAGLATSDGSGSHSGWVADQLRTTRAAAAQECKLAATLHGLPEVLAALERGEISRDHALGVARARAQQRADHDAAERARRQRLDKERQARADRDRAASDAARTAAERERMAREAAEREERLAAAERAAAEARREQARRDERARAEALLSRARQGASPDEVREAGKQARAADAEALERDAAAQWARRSVREWRDRDTGAPMILLTGIDEVAEKARALLDALMPTDDPDSPLDERRSYEQRRFDAFADLLAKAAGAPDLPLARGIKPNINVQTVHETLEGGSLPGRGEYGSVLSAETVRRLACDATLTRTVLSASSQVLDQGRATRDWNIHQWRAAVATFGGCAFPTSEGRACGRPPAWCDLHHVHWWRHGGPTDLANGVPLCTFHHHRVHDDGWELAYDHTTATVTVTKTTAQQPVRRSVTFTALANSPPAGPPGGPTHSVRPDHPDLDLQRLPL